MTDPGTGDQRAGNPGLLARGFLGLIRFYRSGISPLLPPLCRFEPTCSCYAADAIRATELCAAFTSPFTGCFAATPFPVAGTTRFRSLPPNPEMNLRQRREKSALELWFIKYKV